MLVYSNRGLLRLILVRTGSIFWTPRVVFLGVASAIVTFVFQLLLVNHVFAITFKIEHHYGMLTIGSVIYFAVVFRTSIGWQRFWEAISQVNAMYSKWMDAYMQMCSFVNASIDEMEFRRGDPEGKNAEMAASLRERAARVKANFVLLSALAVDRLIHADCERMGRRIKAGAKWQMTRRSLRMEDVTGAWALPQFYVPGQDPVGETEQQYRPLSRSSTDSREGLEQGKNQWAGSRYVVAKLPTEKEYEALRTASDRLVVAQSWVLFELAALANQLKTPAPIQSRMYQELSNGMLIYSQCLKVADVPFPFPFAQMMAIALCVYIILTPIFMAIFTDSIIGGPLVSGLAVAGLWGLNSTAIELENPFGSDDNDIHIGDYTISGSWTRSTRWEWRMARSGSSAGQVSWGGAPGSR